MKLGGRAARASGQGRTGMIDLSLAESIRSYPLIPHHIYLPNFSYNARPPSNLLSLHGALRSLPNPRSRSRPSLLYLDVAASTHGPLQRIHGRHSPGRGFFSRLVRSKDARPIR